MKRLIFLILFLPVLGFSQVSDDSLRTYNDTYIIENNTNSITATQVNTILENIILSKVNQDSATTVRWSTEYDTAFYIWWGRSEDTLFFYIKDANTADQDTIYIGDDYIYVNKGGSGDSTWVQVFVDTLGGYGDCVTKAYIDTIVGCSPVYVDGGVETTTVVTTNLGTAGSHVEMAYIDTCDIGTVFNSDIEIDGGWQDWTPTFSWTGGTPSVSGGVYRYMRVNNTIFFAIQYTVTNETGSTITQCNITLPTAPTDLNIYVPVDGYTLSGSTLGRAFYPYIDATDNTTRRLEHAAFSVPNGTAFTIYETGHYEIE